MSNVVQYRRKIEDCTVRAQQARLPEARELWLAIRSSYELLINLELACLDGMRQIETETLVERI